MSFWNQQITNAVRKGRINHKCVADPTQRSRMRCNSNEHSFEYGYDAKMTPRCDGGPDAALGRSVYYSMRKTLVCPSTVAQKASPSELAKRTAHLTEKQMRILRKHQKMLITQNSLRYQLERGAARTVVKQTVEDNDTENLL